MKTLIILGGITTLILGSLYWIPSTQEYVTEKIVEVEKIVETDQLEARIKIALLEAQASTTSKAQAAYDEDIKKAQAGREAFIEKETKRITDVIKADYIAEIEATITDKDYWRGDKKLRRLIYKAADHYKVSATTMMAIINCESQYSVSIQSQHTYHAGNVPKGYKVGDREQSFGLVQIHLPAHPSVTKEQAVDPHFAVDFLAKNMSAGRASMWSCYKTIAMR